MGKISVFCRERGASVLHKPTSIAGGVLHFICRGGGETILAISRNNSYWWPEFVERKESSNSLSHKREVFCVSCFLSLH